MKKGIVIVISLLVIFAGCYYQLCSFTSPAQSTFSFQQNPDNSVNKNRLNETFKQIANNDVRNIILFIGDGMGFTQIATSRIAEYGPDGHLTMEKMPVTGIMKVHSKNSLITDSAASATAMATGYKTNNKMISMLPDSTRLKTVLEAAQIQGMATGLVATSSITHATPAVFASHSYSRYEHENIAEQMLATKVNVLLGGGKKYFLPDKVPDGVRKDNVNLIEQAQSNGYDFVDTRDALLNATADSLLGLFKPEAMDNIPNEPSLAEMTQQALKILSRNKNGFFLMVEGSQIDWAGHDNDLQYSLREMHSFDEAVKAGLEFAMQDEHTLVIVTADHETGGMNITDGDITNRGLEIKWMSGSHTGGPVPIFAFGPQALNFTGLIDNTDVAKIFGKLLNLEDFPMKY
ncbi:alkaline phosphatase [candidate division KSB1 bacterium]|nr:alkaline phosphatase [candidate division KSB1 bacterium]